MKKFAKIILTLATVSIHCSCIKEDILQNEGRSNIRVYSDLAQTRTEHISENGVTTVSWVKGDNIYLSTVGGRHDLSYVAESSGPTTDFTASGTELVAEDGDVVYAYYGLGFQATGSASSFYLKNTREQYYSYGSAFCDELYAKGTVSNNELALHFKHVFAFLKITIPVDELILDSSTGNYVLRLVSDQSLSAISMMSTIYNIDTSEFSGDSATEVLYFIDEDIYGQEYVTVSVAIMPQTCGGTLNIYSGKESEYLLRTITVPESGLQAGKVYTLTIGDSNEMLRLTKVQSAYSNVASGTNSVTLNLSDGKWYSEIDTNTWETTYYGKGNYLAVDFYSEDGYLAPGIYRPSAVGDIINPGEYGIGYDPGDKWGMGIYFTDFGTCWWTVDQDAYPQASAQKITSGDIVVELEGTVYTITVDNGEVKAKFVGEIPEVTNYDDPVYPSDPWELEGDIVIERQGGLTYTMTDETANNFTVNGNPLSGVTLYKVRINDAAGNDVAVLELVTEEGATSVTGEYRVTVYPDEVGEAGNGYDLSSWGIDISGGTILYDNGNTYLIDADMSMIKIVEENGQITIIVKGTTNGTTIAAKYVILQTQENEDDYIDEYGINHGPGVEIDGVVWAPVNCGYHATDYKYGKLYQWGRKYGQGYSDNNYTDVNVPAISDNITSFAGIQSRENKNVYFTGLWDYYVQNFSQSQLSLIWNAGTEMEPMKSQYDPCPDGWRIPLHSEYDNLRQNHSELVEENSISGYWLSGSVPYSMEAN